MENSKTNISSIFPSFRGLKINDKEILKDSPKLADQLGDYFEKHFSKPIRDPGNNEHIDHSKTCNQIVQLSADIMGIAAYLINCLAVKYISIITVLFNKCALKGKFLEKLVKQLKLFVYRKMKFIHSRTDYVLYHFYRI